MTRGHPREIPRRSRRPAPQASRLLTLALILVCLPACRRQDPMDVQPFHVRVSFGGPGRADGQMVYPRAIDHAPDNTLWIIDKSARVHHFSRAGEYLGGWIMPSFSRGKPVGVTCGPDGLIYIADTHEYRIAVFRPTDTGGVLVDEWGTYGDNLGAFRYVTDVAILPTPDGKGIERFYVSEYGGNDRITAFDADHNPLFAFGEFGASTDADGAVFSRPQSILYEPTLNELIVSDCGNHRIGRFTLEGELIAWIGADDALASSEPGRFGYPYGLASVGDGTILVSEFGTSRVQHIDPRTGASLGIYGVSGRGPGELTFPWAVTIVGREVFVADSGNHRIQSFSLGGQFLPW